MRIIDTHCDALWKIQQAQRGTHSSRKTLRFTDADELATNLTRLQQGKVMVQFFAIFIDPSLPVTEKWYHALEQIEIFHTEVLGKNPKMKQIRSWEELDQLSDDEIGAVLTLEGADAVGDDLAKWHYLHQQGVLSIGMTWNHANLCADGIGEPRGAGLTLFGRELVRLNNAHHILTDVSHLSVKGFWDVMELADYPIASHSNARSICNHPRNLADDQIKELFAKNGQVHLVFYPPFIKESSKTASTSDLMKHLDHFCALGGSKQVGFGSDFDGIDATVTHLEHAGHYQQLINELLKYYSEEEVRGFAYQNFLNNRPKSNTSLGIN